MKTLIGYSVFASGNTGMFPVSAVGAAADIRAGSVVATLATVVGSTFARTDFW
jgi:hypothetical protein